jgi:hypothetical protein
MYKFLEYCVNKWRPSNNLASGFYDNSISKLRLFVGVETRIHIIICR